VGFGIFDPVDDLLDHHHRFEQKPAVTGVIGAGVEVVDDGALFFCTFGREQRVKLVVAVEDDRGTVADLSRGGHHDFIAGDGDHGSGGDGFLHIGDDVEIRLRAQEAGDVQAADDHSAVGVDVEDDGLGTGPARFGELADEQAVCVFIHLAVQGDDGDGCRGRCSGSAGLQGAADHQQTKHRQAANPFVPHDRGFYSNW
jgi:hypothetical protein